MPNFSCEYLPIKRPKKVKDAAQRLKITPDKMTSLVMALNPRPVEKLSKLTETDTKNILNKFNSKNLSSCLINSIIISIPINNKIKKGHKKVHYANKSTKKYYFSFTNIKCANTKTYGKCIHR